MALQLLSNDFLTPASLAKKIKKMKDIARNDLHDMANYTSLARLDRMQTRKGILAFQYALESMIEQRIINKESDFVFKISVSVDSKEVGIAVHKYFRDQGFDVTSHKEEPSFHYENVNGDRYNFGRKEPDFNVTLYCTIVFNCVY